MNSLRKSKNLLEYKGEDEVISIYEKSIELLQEPETILNVKSKIPSLDEYIQGFRDGELYIISGATKNGKTLFAQTLTKNFADEQNYSLWFSFEIPIRQFLEAFGNDPPLIYIPKTLKANAIGWFEDRVIESFEKYHTRIIFIDHLHYLIDLEKLRNPSIEIGQIIRRLKTFAIKERFLIFLICHTTKGMLKDSDLNYEAIRDSSFISQESDCVMMIKRKPWIMENYALLKVDFHRRTGIMNRRVELVKGKSGFLEEYLPAKIEQIFKS